LNEKIKVAPWNLDHGNPVFAAINLVFAGEEGVLLTKLGMTESGRLSK
jgi:hypothetical protein